MNYEVEERIVKHNNDFWVIVKVSDSGMATIWKNGDVAVVPESTLEYVKEIPKD